MPAAPNPPEALVAGAAAPRILATPGERRLFALLTICTIFEGFDTKLAMLVLPVIGPEFGVGNDVIARALSASSLGMPFAFFLMRLADRVGRRPVFLASVAGYATLTLATAFVPGLAAFTALQLAARLLMVTELALAYLILSETLAPEVRGRANGWLGAFASFGASIPALLLAPLEDAGVGWRGLFALGAIPLLLFPLYWRGVRETPVFARSHVPPPASLRAEFRAMAALAAPGWRARLVGITTLWVTVSFWSGTALSFFVLFVFQERGWTSHDLQWLTLGTIPAGFAGYGLAGWLMDRVGRRAAAVAYLVAGTALTAVCFQSEERWVIAAGYWALIGLNGVWTVATTLTAELYPTELRGAALGLTQHLLGRIGLVLGPLATAELAKRVGSTGDAVTWLALANLACVPLLLALVPETRGTDLSAVADAR